MASRIVVMVAAALLSAAGLGAPVAAADVALPPITPTYGGPIIGGGDEAAQARIALQLNSFDNPDVQESDGNAAAGFIAASAGSANPDFSVAFTPLQRALVCQRDNSSFGARAYRRTDGQWGGAVLVVAKSATSNLDALTTCIKIIWPRPKGASMCASGWTYPTSGENHRPETYYILLAGTSGDFCGSFDTNYANYATKWP
jgi:hypothetical protein